MTTYLGRVDRRKGLRFAGWLWVGLCFASVFFQIFMVVKSGPSVFTGFADDGFDDTPDQTQADPDQVTPYLQDIGDALRRDPVWIDPLVASTYGRAWVDDSVRAAVKGRSEATYLVVMPKGSDDGSGGDPELIARRLAQSMGQDGVFLLIQGRSPDAVSTIPDTLDPGLYVYEASRDEFAAAIDDLEVKEKSGPRGPLTQMWFGFLMGIPYVVVGVFLGMLITRAARRNTSYVEGFVR